MALSLREKRSLQAEVEVCLESLAQSLGLREKRGFQQRLQEALDKLLGTATQIAKTIYERLVAGEFLNETIHKFILMLKDAYKEVQSVEKLRQPTLEYVEKHSSELFLTNGQADVPVLESTQINLKSALESPEKFLELFVDLQRKIGNKKVFMTIQTNA